MVCDDFFESFRIEVPEGQVFQFAADFAHAEAVRNGRIDLDGFARDALPPLGAQVAERAHVVETVGQLDDDDANVVDHGQQHFAKALGLPLFGGEEIELAQLGDAIDAARYFFAEVLADLIDRHAGVFHQVVQQAGLDGDRIHAHAGENVGDHQRMHHVGFAGVPQLTLVKLAGGAEGLLYRGEIVARAVFPNLGFQFVKQLLDSVRGWRYGWYWRGTGQLGGH